MPKTPFQIRARNIGTSFSTPYAVRTSLPYLKTRATTAAAIGQANLGSAYIDPENYTQQQQASKSNKPSVGANIFQDILGALSVPIAGAEGTIGGIGKALHGGNGMDFLNTIGHAITSQFNNPAPYSGYNMWSDMISGQDDNWKGMPGWGKALISLPTDFISSIPADIATGGAYLGINAVTKMLRINKALTAVKNTAKDFAMTRKLKSMDWDDEAIQGGLNAYKAGALKFSHLYAPKTVQTAKRLKGIADTLGVMFVPGYGWSGVLKQKWAKMLNNAHGKNNGMLKNISNYSEIKKFSTGKVLEDGVKNVSPEYYNDIKTLGANIKPHVENIANEYTKAGKLNQEIELAHNEGKSAIKKELNDLNNGKSKLKPEEVASRKMELESELTKYSPEELDKKKIATEKARDENVSKEREKITNLRKNFADKYQNAPVTSFFDTLHNPEVQSSEYFQRVLKGHYNNVMSHLKDKSIPRDIAQNSLEKIYDRLVDEHVFSENPNSVRMPITQKMKELLDSAKNLIDKAKFNKSKFAISDYFSTYNPEDKDIKDLNDFLSSIGLQPAQFIDPTEEKETKALLEKWKKEYETMSAKAKETNSKILPQKEFIANKTAEFKENNPKNLMLSQKGAWRWQVTHEEYESILKPMVDAIHEIKTTPKLILAFKELENKTLLDPLTELANEFSQAKHTAIRTATKERLLAEETTKIENKVRRTLEEEKRLRIEAEEAKTNKDLPTLEEGEEAGGVHPDLLAQEEAEKYKVDETELKKATEEALAKSQTIKNIKEMDVNTKPTILGASIQSGDKEEVNSNLRELGTTIENVKTGKLTMNIENEVINKRIAKRDLEGLNQTKKDLDQAVKDEEKATREVNKQHLKVNSAFKKLFNHQDTLFKRFWKESERQLISEKIKAVKYNDAGKWIAGEKQLDDLDFITFAKYSLEARKIIEKAEEAAYRKDLEFMKGARRKSYTIMNAQRAAEKDAEKEADRFKVQKHDFNPIKTLKDVPPKKNNIEDWERWLPFNRGEKATVRAYKAYNPTLMHHIGGDTIGTVIKNLNRTIEDVRNARSLSSELEDDIKAKYPVGRGEGKYSQSFQNEKIKEAQLKEESQYPKNVRYMLQNFDANLSQIENRLHFLTNGLERQRIRISAALARKGEPIPKDLDTGVFKPFERKTDTDTDVIAKKVQDKLDPNHDMDFSQTKAILSNYSFSQFLKDSGHVEKINNVDRENLRKFAALHSFDPTLTKEKFAQEFPNIGGRPNKIANYSRVELKQLYRAYVLTNAKMLDDSMARVVAKHFPDFETQRDVYNARANGLLKRDPETGEINKDLKDFLNRKFISKARIAAAREINPEDIKNIASKFNIKVNGENVTPQDIFDMVSKNRGENVNKQQAILGIVNKFKNPIVNLPEEGTYGGHMLTTEATEEGTYKEPTIEAKLAQKIIDTQSNLTRSLSDLDEKRTKIGELVRKRDDIQYKSYISDVDITKPDWKETVIKNNKIYKAERKEMLSEWLSKKPGLMRLLRLKEYADKLEKDVPNWRYPSITAPDEVHSHPSIVAGAGGVNRVFNLANSTFSEVSEGVQSKYANDLNRYIPRRAAERQDNALMIRQDEQGNDLGDGNIDNTEEPDSAEKILEDYRKSANLPKKASMYMQRSIASEHNSIGGFNQLYDYLTSNQLIEGQTHELETNLDKIMMEFNKGPYKTMDGMSQVLFCGLNDLIKVGSLADKKDWYTNELQKLRKVLGQPKVQKLIYLVRSAPDDGTLSALIKGMHAGDTNLGGIPVPFQTHRMMQQRFKNMELMSEDAWRTMAIKTLGNSTILEGTRSGNVMGDFENFVRSIDAEFKNNKSAGGHGMVLIDSQMRNFIENTYSNASTKFIPKLMNAINKIMSWWKSITLMTPGYFIRNFVGNQLNGLAKFGNNIGHLSNYNREQRNIMLGMKAWRKKFTIFSRASHEEKIKNMINMFNSHEFINLAFSNSYNFDKEAWQKVVNKEFEEKDRENVMKVAEIIHHGLLDIDPENWDKDWERQQSFRSLAKLPGRVTQNLSDKHKVWQNYIDGASRGAAYFTAKKYKETYLSAKGNFMDSSKFHKNWGEAENLNDENQVQQKASALAKFIHFDYNNLTPFEQRFMTNFIPFYTWQRKNLQFQLRNSLYHPSNATVWFRMVSDIQQSMGLDPLNSPDSMVEYGYLPVFKEDNHLTLMKFNAPITDMYAILSPNVLSRINPIFTSAITAMSGKDFATGNSITDYTSGGLLPTPIRDIVNNLIYMTHPKGNISSDPDSPWGKFINNQVLKAGLGSFTGRPGLALSALTNNYNYFSNSILSGYDLNKVAARHYQEWLTAMENKMLIKHLQNFFIPTLSSSFALARNSLFNPPKTNWG